MKTFTNENAIKSFRRYGILFILAFACLIGIGIAIYIGMGYVNELIKLEPNLAV